MANFFKSLFGGKSDEKEEKQKQESRNFEILKFDGLRAQRIGRADYAVKCFTEALALQEDFETMSYLSALYLRMGETQQAIPLLQRMTELEPSLPLPYLTLANAWYVEENYEEMEKNAQKATELTPEEAAAFYLWGKARNCRKDPIGAIAHLTKALTLKEDHTEAQLLRAEVLLDMGQAEESKKDIKAILANDPEQETALLLRGRYHEMTSQPDAAEADYRELIALNPFNETAYTTLSRLFTTCNRHTEAIALLDEAIELNPESSDLFQQRGEARLLQGDKEGSVHDLKRALELKPDTLDALNGQYQNQPTTSANVLGGL